MRVVSLPARLKAVAVTIALSIPLAGVDAVLTERSPWWRLPYQSAGYAMIAAGVSCLPVLCGLLRGKRWTVHALEVLGVAWSLFGLYGAIRAQEPLLGLFAVFCMGYWLGLSMWLRHEMDRSYFNSRVRWYQRAPKPIPGLECCLAAESSMIGLRVSRLDDDGVFVFSDRAITGVVPSSSPGFARGKSTGFQLSYRDRQVKCHGFPIVALPSNAGYGFQFGGMSADERKILGDFVEILRGEGHV